MKFTLQDEAAVRIRGLQAIYADAHNALTNWGAWSRDRGGIFPVLAEPGWVQFYRPDENEAWGEVKDEHDGDGDHLMLVVKAEASEKTPYDELQALLLDERMHAAGGLSQSMREAIKAAYVNVAIEYQFPRFCSCSLDGYCERLEGALLFVRRFL